MLDKPVETLGARFHRLHGPTWVVAVTIYAGWLGLTFAHDRVPLPLLALLGAVVIAWQGSLQHETIHGHPAGPRWVGAAIGAPALSLWLPYDVYRDTHRRHHATHRLTDPSHDPEAPSELDGGWLEASQRTVVGRLTLGPAMTIGAFLWSELGSVIKGEPGHRRAWARHALSVAVVLAWLVGVAHMPAWKYLIAFVYPGTSLTLLRSLAEHRADAAPERRTTVVEAGLFFRLLFLNNNFHVAHHAAPRAPWFELPRIWDEQRASFAARAPDLIHPGYLALARRRLLRAS